MEIINMKNFKPLNFVVSDCLTSCTHNIDKHDVWFSIDKTEDGFYKTYIVSADKGMFLEFMTMRRAQIWANYIYCQMLLGGVFQSFEKHENLYAVKCYKKEVA
jgi:hypothetical protein